MCFREFRGTSCYWKEDNFSHLAHELLEMTHVGWYYLRAPDFSYCSINSWLGNFVVALIPGSVFIENLLLYSHIRLSLLWLKAVAHGNIQLHVQLLQCGMAASQGPHMWLIDCTRLSSALLELYQKCQRLQLQPPLIPHSMSDSPARQLITGAEMNFLLDFPPVHDGNLFSCSCV